jgi:hypothetical protein
VVEEYRSGLSEDEVEELARKVMGVICQEWPRLRDNLDSSVVYTRLMEEGIQPPDYAMCTRSTGSTDEPSVRTSVGEAKIKSVCTAG